MKFLMSLDPAAMIASALNVLLPLTAVCLIALIAVRGLFRRDPSARYFACLAGLICLLLIPLIVCIQTRIGSSLVTLSLPQKVFLSSLPVTRVSPTRLIDIGMKTGASEASVLQKWLFWGAWAVPAVWAAGVAWGIARLLRGWREAARLTDGLPLWKASAPIEAPAQWERVLGRSLPPIYLSPRVVSPVAVGLFRPAVILPAGLPETLSPTQLRQVILHEGAHVAFRHAFSGVLERVVGLLFWPHPLVRALCRELARSREEVCDNVASQEGGAACYARTLLAVAQGIDTAPNITPALALQGPGTSLEERIAGLLDPRRNRMVRVTRGKLWAVTGVAVLALGSTVVVRVVASEAKAKRQAERVTVSKGSTSHSVLITTADGKTQEVYLDYRPNSSSDAEELAAKRTAEAKAKGAAAPGGRRLNPRDSAASGSELLAAKRKAEAEYMATRGIVPAGRHAEPPTAEAKRKAEAVEREIQAKLAARLKAKTN